MSRRRAALAMLLALTLTLISSTGEARDRGETCTSYTTAGGTTIEDCRDKNGHSTHCEFDNILRRARRGPNADDQLGPDRHCCPAARPDQNAPSPSRRLAQPSGAA